MLQSPHHAVKNGIGFFFPQTLTPALTHVVSRQYVTHLGRECGHNRHGTYKDISYSSWMDESMRLHCNTFDENDRCIEFDQYISLSEIAIMTYIYCHVICVITSDHKFGFLQI